MEKKYKAKINKNKFKMESKSNLPCGYDYSPHFINTEVKESPIHGLGVFAIADIEHSESLGFSHIDIYGECIRINAGGFLNHSDNPNAAL